MAALTRRLQTQGFCSHKSQQSLPSHKYKKPELQTGLLGPGALLLPFLFQLSIKQGQ